jgi:hypothetical protein
LTISVCHIDIWVLCNISNVTLLTTRISLKFETLECGPLKVSSSNPPGAIFYVVSVYTEQNFDFISNASGRCHLDYSVIGSDTSLKKSRILLTV